MTDSHATRDVSRDVRLVVADIDGILLTPDKVLAEHIVEMAKAEKRGGNRFGMSDEFSF